MRVHVALTPAGPRPFALDGCVAIVIDVLRATTTVVAACGAGCLGVIPVADSDAARAVAAGRPRDAVVLGGERGGEPILGFDLGNSPIEYTAERVGGRTVILTTTNGTRAMKSTGGARASAVAALTNVSAAAEWAVTQGRHVTVLCAGDDGALSLEDAVCAGLLVQRMALRAPGVELSDAAVVALRLAEYYRGRLGEVGRDSRWARRLAQRGRSADIDACLRLDTTVMVPVFEAGIIVPGPPARDGLEEATAADGARGPGPEAGR
jgi:2-phosphosulfolactate phosphatase